MPNGKHLFTYLADRVQSADFVSVLDISAIESLEAGTVDDSSPTPYHDSSLSPVPEWRNWYTH